MILIKMMKQAKSKIELLTGIENEKEGWLRDNWYLF